MRIPNMSDEELDSLFRRGAEAYPDDVHPGAWARMEDKLNEAAATQRLRQQVTGGFVTEVATVVLLLLLWQGYQFVQPATETARPPARTVRKSSAAGPAMKGLETAGGPISQAKTAVSAPPPYAAHAPAYGQFQLSLRGPAPAGAAIAVLPPAAPGPAARTRFPLAAALLASAERRPVAANRFAQGATEQPTTYPAGAEKATPAGRAQRADGLAAAPSATADGPVDAAVLRAATPDLLAPTAPAQLPVPAHGLAAQDTLVPPAAPRAADSTRAEKRPPARPAYRLVVGVLGAPAVSAVRTAQTARLGGDLGLTLEYRLTLRLRVRAGLIRSVKRYKAPSADYQVPAAWQWFTADYAVNANCRITEIPLDLRYDVLSRPTYTVFTSLGINSLLMRDERYSYDWVLNGQTNTRAARVVNGSSHALSVLNLSAGVERPLGRRWSVQAEPFWQVPLGRVGAGQVRLSSAGAAFSLKYGLLR